MTKIKIIILLLVFNGLLYGHIFAQKEAWKWYFEQYNGLDFSGDTVKYISGCQFGKNESSSSICDSNGNILFYSNGITLYNKYNKIVKNGTKLGFEAGTNITSSYQGTLLLKHPDNDSLIYLFSTDLQGKSGGVVYAIVNIHGNNDSGEVLQKKIKLISPINEPVSAVYHQNGRDIWIVCHSHGKDYFYVYLLSRNGIINCPIVTQIGAYHWDGGADAQVAMKFSPNGKYLTHDQLLWGNTETFFFNDETGNIEDTAYIYPMNIAYGFEFSPDSRFLYLRLEDSGLIQIDLIKKNKTNLTAFNQSSLPVSLQLAHDHKIYGSIANSKDLLIIEQPKRYGDSCHIVIKKNFLQNTVPTALPNFNQSYFYTPSIDYKYEQNCISNNIQFWGKDTFKATNYNWQIRKSGKPVEATYSTKDINHIFIDTGKYEVRYIASNGSRQDTVIKNITIYPKINKNFLGKDTLYVQGTSYSRLLTTPANMHCIRWQDGSGFTAFTADTAGIYICKVTNRSFCEVVDTVIISECINNLTAPSIYRSRDTLYTYQPLADSFVWYRNGQVFKITKETFIRLTDTGTYRVEAAKKGHCNRSSSFQVHKLGTGRLRAADLQIRLYPNPAQGKVFIETDTFYHLTVTDVSGRVMLDTDNPMQVHLPAGVYFFRFTINGSQATEMVLVY